MKNLAYKAILKKLRLWQSGSITSWQIEVENIEAVTDFILGGSKMTEDNDYSNEIQRHMLLGRKAMMNIDSMLKSKDHFTDKGPYIQSYV